MDFNLDKSIKIITDILDLYDNERVYTYIVVKTLMAEMERLFNFYRDEFDNLNEADKVRCVRTMYGINATLAKIFTDANITLYDQKVMILSARHDILNVDFSWKKED